MAAVDETVMLAPFIGEDSQLWKIDQLAGGSYRLASKAGKLALTATIKIKSGIRDDAQGQPPLDRRPGLVQTGNTYYIMYAANSVAADRALNSGTDKRIIGWLQFTSDNRPFTSMGSTAHYWMIVLSNLVPFAVGFALIAGSRWFLGKLFKDEAE